MEKFDFIKLTADVTAAIKAGEEAASKVDDGGTCNMDGVVLSIPGQRERKVILALSMAGVDSHKADWGWCGKGYMINPPPVGQANKNKVASEAIGKYLREAGYDATQFYMMD